MENNAKLISDITAKSANLICLNSLYGQVFPPESCLYFNILFILGNSDGLIAIPVGYVFRRSDLVYEVVYFNGSSSVWPGQYSVNY